MRKQAAAGALLLFPFYWTWTIGAAVGLLLWTVQSRPQALRAA